MSRKSFGGSAGGGRKGSGVTYVKGDPAFLRRMKEAVGYREPQADLDAKRADLAQAAAAAAGAEDGGAEERDDERPVVVALRQGDLTPEEARREWDREKEREREQDDDAPPADGKILFKKPTKRKTGEEDTQGEADKKSKKVRGDAKGDKKDKKKKKPASKSLLSFDEDEEDQEDF